MPESSGEYAFLFTDIQGNTSMDERAPAVMTVALARHFEIGYDSVARFGGRVVKSMGDGLMAVFSDPRCAIQAALDYQLLLLREPWPEQTPILVRMGLDFGSAIAKDDGDFQGGIINKAARVSSSAHGGQVLLGPQIVAAVSKPIVARGRAVSLGLHRLAGILEPVELFQLVHPGLPRHFGPPRTLAVATDNAPRTDTAFFGREAAMSDLRQALQESRIVSLIGPGGIGKTRLAAEWVKRSRAEAKKPARFLVVEPGFDAASARERLRAELGLPWSPDLRQVLSEVSLLVLDNCESALDAAAAFAQEASAHVPVLVTSTAPLDLSTERVIPLRPLAMPANAASGAGVHHNPAVELFRWVFVRRGGDPGQSEGGPAWSRLIERTGGLPLAVEILAAAAADRGVSETLAALEDGEANPASPFRDAPARHRTLQTAFESVVPSLADPDRAILVALAEAPDGLGGHLIAKVAGVGRGRQTGASCSRLVRMALAQQTHGGRLAVVEALRPMVLERLSGPEAAQRFVSTFVGETAHQGVRLRGASSRRALAFFAQNRRNIAKALSHEASAHAALAFGRWLVDEGQIAEAERWLAPLTEDGREHVCALASALMGNVFRLRQRPGDAYAWCERALRSAAEPGVEGYAMSVRLLTLMDERRYDEAAREADELLRRPEHAHGATPSASALTNVGLMHRKSGRTIEARQLFDQAARRHAMNRDVLGEARALFNVAITYFDEMDHESAKPYVERALDRFRLCGNVSGIAHCIHGLGDVYYYAGDLDDALRRYRNASRRFTQLGHVWMAIAAELSVANVLYRQERWNDAATLLERLFVDAISQQVPEHAAHALDTLVGVWSHRGRPEVVFVLGCTARRLRDGAAIDPHCPVPVEAFLKRAQDALGRRAPTPSEPPRTLLDATRWIQAVYAMRHP